MHPDAELLRRYVEDRSEIAFTELVHRHVNLVYCAALRQVGGNEHRAKDVAQTVFTDLARKAAALRRHTMLSGWLHTSVRFAAAKVRRNDSFRQQREREATTMNAILSDSVTDWEQLRPLIDNAIHELDERDREAVLLRYFENRPFAEIGAVLRVSEDAARMRIDRALEKLRATLSRHGVKSTSAALAIAFANQLTAAIAPTGLGAAIANAALASIASGGAAAASTGIFMNATKIATAITSFLAVTAIGVNVYQARERGLAESALVSLRQERDNQNALLAQKSREADARHADLQKTVESLRASVDSTSSPNVRAPVPSVPPANPAELVLTNPEMLQLSLKQYEATVGLKYGPLYRSLGFSPDQVKRFEEIMVKGNQAMMDFAVAARAQKFSSTDPALRPLENQSEADGKRQLSELLGDDGMKQFQQYERTRNARTLVDSLATNVYYTETPLVGQQADQLVQILTKHSAGYQKIGMVGRNDIDLDAAITEAQGMLSVPQIAALRALQEQATLQRQMDQLAKTLQQSSPPRK